MTVENLPLCGVRADLGHTYKGGLSSIKYPGYTLEVCIEYGEYHHTEGGGMCVVRTIENPPPKASQNTMKINPS